MSYTEIYSFDHNGNASLAAEIHNSWRGAMAIWRILEKRYLPPYIPDCVKRCVWYRKDMSAEEVTTRLGYTPSRCLDPFERGNAMREIWDLADNQSIPEHERITLFTTFDKALVKKENLPAVIEAFQSFEGETNLPEQAKELKKLSHDENCIAVGWNQTSVSGDTWSDYAYDELKDETIPYNCLEQRDHYWIFDELQKN